MAEPQKLYRQDRHYYYHPPLRLNNSLYLPIFPLFHSLYVSTYPPKLLGCEGSSESNSHRIDLQTTEKIADFRLPSTSVESLQLEASRSVATPISRLNPDVDVDDLYSELRVLQVTLPDKTMSAVEALEFIRDAECYPNVPIAYRILLTVPVTVASAEKSFSKLKLLKSYLRSTMSHERLNGLAILSIEKDMIKNVDVDAIITEFASRSAQRSCFA